MSFFGFPSDLAAGVDINAETDHPGSLLDLIVDEPEPVDPAIPALRLALDALHALWASPAAPTPSERLEGLALWLHALEALDRRELMPEDRRRIERAINRVEESLGMYIAQEISP